MLHSAIEFVRAAPEHDNPIELLEALQGVGRKHRQRLRVQGIWSLSAPQVDWVVNRSTFFHPDFPGQQLVDERRALVVAQGTTALGDYFKTQTSLFTLTEPCAYCG